MVTFKIDKTTGFDAAGIAKIYDAANMLCTVLNSDAFKRELNNDTIYKLIMDGAELGKPDIDHCVNINITLYNKWWSKVIGYTYPGSMRTWVNKKFFNSMSSAELASHLCHEWCHLLGRSDKGPFNAYYIGGIVANIAERLGFV